LTFCFIGAATIVASACSNVNRTLVDRSLEHQFLEAKSSLSFQEAFPGADVQFVCILDEFTSSRGTLRNLRLTGRTAEVEYLSDVDQVPEEMIGILVVESDGARMHLLDTWRVKLALTSQDCADYAGQFEQDSEGVWMVGGNAFRSYEMESE
jgi:hypothetical protein